MAPNALGLIQDHHPSVAHRALEHSTERAPSPPVIRQQAQHTIHLPVISAPTASLRTEVVEPENRSLETFPEFLDHLATEGSRHDTQDRACEFLPNDSN